MQIHVVDSFFRLFEGRFMAVFQENLSGTEYLGRPVPIIEKSQDQDQGQGQGQDQIMWQRSALQQQMVLALTLVLVLRFCNYQVVPYIPPLISSLELLLRLRDCCY